VRGRRRTALVLCASFLFRSWSVVRSWSLVLGPAVIVTGSLVAAEGPALTLHARAAAAGASTGPITIELFRWSTDSERAPLVAALSAPTPPPAAPAAPAPGRGAGRAGGRGARGGRAAAGAPPVTPAPRLHASLTTQPAR